MKLTNRERWLLFFLALLLINIVGIYFTIMPMMQEVSDLRAELDVAVMDLQVKLSVSSTLAEREKKLAELQEETKLLTNEYLPILRDDQIDSFLYDNINKHTKNWNRLFMEEYQAAPVDTEETAAMTYIQSRHVVVEIKGTAQVLINVLKTLQESPYCLSIKAMNIAGSGRTWTGKYTIEIYALQ